MQIGIYDTVVNSDCHTVLVEEKSVDYNVETLTTPASAVEMINRLTGLNVKGEENCYIVAFNTKSKPLGIFFLARGTVNLCLVGPREVFLRALLIGAAHIILFHNHPSLVCTPSEEDILLTKKLKEAGELIGIPLMDHIIIGGDNYYSFREQKSL